MITSLGGVRVLGMHHFHTSEPVLSITAAAVNLRNDKYVEVEGFGQCRCRIRIGSCDEAIVWLQVYELLSERREAATGRPRNQWDHFNYFVVDETGKQSNGLIQVHDGDICLVG